MHKGLPKTSGEALNCKASACLLSNEGESTNYKKQSPLMNRVYSNRCKLLHKIVSISSQFSHNCQLMLVGAGLDTSYDKYFSVVYAVDLPEVIEERRKTSNSHTTLIAADLTQLDVFISNLAAVKFNFEQPTVILIECVLSYISYVHTANLLKSLATLVPTSMLVLYDPLLKSTDSVSNGFSQKMRNDFGSRGAPLLSSHTSIFTLNESLRRAQWAHIHSATINQGVKSMLSGAERSVLVRSEPFDEFASLAAVQNHYSVSFASNCAAWFQYTLDTIKRAANDGVDISGGTRLSALMARISAAEERLSSWECFQAESKAPSSSTSPHLPSGSFVLGDATNADSEAVVALYTEEFSAIAAEYRSVKKFIKSNTKPLRNIESYFSRKAANNFVKAEIAEVVVGCVGYRECHLSSSSVSDEETNTKTVELSHLCVHKAHRGSGIGRALVEKVISECRVSGVVSIQLSVLSDLVAARKLYMSLGFTVKKRDDLGSGCLLDYMILQL